MARTRRRQLGAFPRDHIGRRQETILRASGRYRRRREYARRGGAVMRALIAASVVTIALLPMATLAQTAPPRAAAPKAATKSPVPRSSDGKPDLTGVWQGGST